MIITAILPISRLNYLDRVLKSYRSQTVRPDRLIVLVQGNVDFQVQAEKILDGIADITLVNLGEPGSNIHIRRTNISKIHNSVKEHIDGDWVFSFEDDGVLPPDAVERLLAIAEERAAGMVTGVELGRWGNPYVGAWVADDVYDLKTISTLKSKAKEGGVDEVDAAGLYCAMIRADLYKSHHFNHDNGLGPDVNLGLEIRRKGYKNYIDWGVHVTHLTNVRDLEYEIYATDYSKIVELTKSNDSWKLT